jgi:hypothetical protein
VTGFSIREDLDMPKEGHWHVLKVRRGFDVIAAERLREEGFAVHLPQFGDGSPKRNRDSLYLRGYVFCRFKLADLPSILSITGVAFVVGHPIPFPVEAAELALIQKIERLGVILRSVPVAQTGRRVRLTGGPFKGVEGYLVDRNSKQFLAINLKCVRRALIIEIEGWPMEPVRSFGASPQ